jgi:hypothetical protein
MLRLTAKSTQFGHKTFTSWLIESAGTVPIKRRKDFVEGAVDNSDAMLKLMEVSTRYILFLLISYLAPGFRVWGCNLFVPGGYESVPSNDCPS